ncbi:MAG: type IV pilin N-terminal domain-containing protein [Thermoplasmata archaeon]|nr:type IV pilin N-terminal domain-containing protein [Thermoplasmata archaeon]
MRTIGAIRRDREAVSPVIATILMVAITVVLAAVLYVMVSGLVSGPGATPDAIGVTVSQSSNGLNWILTFADVPAGKANSTVSLSISDGSGAVLLAATSLDALGGVSETYSPITSGSTLAAGDRVLLTVATYPAGSTYQLIDANGVLAQGTLQ